MEQQIVFRIEQQSFAVPITATDKIIHLEHVTKVPDSSSYVMGVMDVEGNVLPVIHLPERLYHQSLENPSEAQVLIVEWKGVKIGLAVDEVQSVQSYPSEHIDREMNKVSSIDDAASPVSAFIRTENGIVLALDIDRLFEEKGTLEIQKLMDVQTDAASTVTADAE